MSPERFQPYLNTYDGRVDLAARLYAWNIELTTAFWGPISVLEVVLRNCLHDALRAGRRDDWWNDYSIHLLDRGRRRFLDADEAVRRRGVSEPTPGQVVAATSLGAWVALTDAGIPRHPQLSYETSLWQPRLARAFSNLAGMRRKELHRVLDDVRFFRNRLAHHEPIYRAPLRRIRDDIIGLAESVHSDAARFISTTQRIDETLARKRDVIAEGYLRT